MSRPRRPARPRKPAASAPAPSRVETLRIVGLGHLGDGVAHLEGGAVHVPLTAPGDLVRARVAGARAEVLEVLEEGPDRVPAPCPAFGTCGGCSVQHLSAPAQADFKRQAVLGALAAHGIEAVVDATVATPPGTRRRAALTLRPRERNTAAVGFQARGTNAVVDLDACPVLHPALSALIAPLKALAPRLLKPKSEMRAHLLLTGAGVDLELAGGRAPDAALLMDLAEFAGAHDLARLTLDREVVALRRPPVLRVGGAPVPVPPRVFAQASAEGEAALIAAVLAGLEGMDPPPDRILDLFCGVGTFAFPLAAIAPVHGVEGDADALAAFEGGIRALDRERGGASAAAKRLSFARRDLFRSPLRVEELAGATLGRPLSAQVPRGVPKGAGQDASGGVYGPESGSVSGGASAATGAGLLSGGPHAGASHLETAAVVIDPPRAGAEAQFRELAAARATGLIPRIVSVSCNPATFARDARILLDAGYTLTRVTPIDQFVWSAHVEVVGVFGT
ncbi:class I SAM-dependent RNA methyltransferase [Futiania mangrovi]|uniref:RNA methyltransferase n=1 Tax=Futiania mangrovi TaxID=2959716 RepID=A0A9J6PDI0_9PROT|nr:hypothetical protein [Futiania mangrovii]MCP1337453.1 hypothetical protein [Futiania mangrovii]